MISLSNLFYDCSTTNCLSALSNVNLDQIATIINCDKNGHLLIYHQNIRGLSSKSNEILNLWSIPLPQILCFTEHHLNNEIFSMPINFYKLGFDHYRKLCKGGGVCIYVH